MVNLDEVASIKDKISRMGAEYQLGNVSKLGHVYNPIPFTEFADIPFQRNACYERFELIKNSLPNDIHHKTLLDLGCHTGFNCYQFANLDWQCTGIEAEPLTAEIAQDISQLYDLGISFHCAKVTSELISELGQHEVCLFLSLFQWLVKANGFDVAAETLATALQHCNILYFETSTATEGKARIAELPDQLALIRLLEIVAQGQFSIENLGPVQAPSTHTQNDMNLSRFIFKLTRK